MTLTKEKSEIIFKNTDSDELIDPTFDAFFKKIIQHKSYRKALSKIISILFNYDEKYVYTNLVFTNTELIKKKYKLRGMTTDIIATIGNDKINIEMDRSGKTSSKIKDTHYHHALVNEDTKRGKELINSNSFQIRIEKKWENK